MPFIFNLFSNHFFNLVVLVLFFVLFWFSWQTRTLLWRHWFSCGPLTAGCFFFFFLSWPSSHWAWSKKTSLFLHYPLSSLFPSGLPTHSALNLVLSEYITTTLHCFCVADSRWFSFIYGNFSFQFTLSPTQLVLIRMTLKRDTSNIPSTLRPLSFSLRVTLLSKYVSYSLLWLFISFVVNEDVCIF